MNYMLDDFLTGNRAKDIYLETFVETVICVANWKNSVGDNSIINVNNVFLATSIIKNQKKSPNIMKINKAFPTSPKI